MESTGKLRPVRVIKAHSGSGDIPPLCLKWILEGGGGLPLAPAALFPRRDPVPVGGGWVSARPVWTDTGEEKNFAPTGNRTSHRPDCRKWEPR